MKLYRTELDSGLNNKQFLVESENLGIKNVKDRIKVLNDLEYPSEIITNTNQLIEQLNI